MNVIADIKYTIDKIDAILDYLSVESIPSAVTLERVMSDLDKIIALLRGLQGLFRSTDTLSLVQTEELIKILSIEKVKLRIIIDGIRGLDRPSSKKQAMSRETLGQVLSTSKSKLHHMGLTINDSLGELKPVDFLIITALDDELHAVLDKLPVHKKLAPSEQDVRVYYSVDLPIKPLGNSRTRCNVIVTSMLGMGRVQASITTSDAIQRFQPKYVMLVGIAGGVSSNGVNLGDVLIAEQIVDYELQKQKPTTADVRWVVYPCDPRLLGFAKSALPNDWHILLSVERPSEGEPVCHFGPVASGDKVVAYTKIVHRYQGVWSKLIGIEMEAGGVAPAAHQSPMRPGFFMVKSVSDFADTKKDDSWRIYACDVAASYAVSLIKSHPIP